MERRALLGDHVANGPLPIGEWFVKTGFVDAETPDTLAAAADDIAVFRVEPA